MVWTWPLMQHGSASGVVLWRALANTGRARACRRSSDSGGSGWMARTWPRMLHRSASVVVLWRALAETGRASACRSSSESVVVWSAGQVCREAERSASLVVVV
jgi:hypothetical protein